MIGSLDLRHGDVTVVGAGIAGLLLAHALDRRGFRVTLLEARDRAGGLIETRVTPHGLAETAAQSFLASPALRELCAGLGVELVAIRRDARARYIWRGGALRRFPLGAGEGLTAFTRALFARAPTADSAETIEAWGLRHLGPAAVDYLFNPMLRGIYAARPSELAIAAVFPSLRPGPGGTLAGSLLARRRSRRMGGPVPLPSGPMMAPRLGMGSLVTALERDLEAKLGSRFQKGREVTALPDAPNLALCVPAPAAARLLSGAGISAGPLAAIRYVPLVTLTLFLELPYGGPRGVGVLIPEKESEGLEGVLGVLFNSSAFEGRARDGLASFTVMLGGTSAPEAPGWTEARLLELASRAVAAVAGIPGGAASPVHAELTRWPGAIPLHDGSLLRAWEHARADWCAKPGRLLFGNYTGQVSLRGMTESAAALPRR